MVRSRLHVICGNCGCNEEMTHTIEPKWDCDEHGVEHPAVVLRCGNCITQHRLSDTAPEKRGAPQ